MNTSKKQSERITFVVINIKLNVRIVDNCIN